MDWEVLSQPSHKKLCLDHQLVASELVHTARSDSCHSSQLSYHNTSTGPTSSSIRVNTQFSSLSKSCPSSQTQHKTTTGSSSFCNIVSAAVDTAKDGSMKRKKVDEEEKELDLVYTKPSGKNWLQPGLLKRSILCT